MTVQIISTEAPISEFPTSGFIERELLTPKIVADVKSLELGHPIAILNKNINILRQTNQGKLYAIADPVIEAQSSRPGENEIGYITVNDYLYHLKDVLDYYQSSKEKSDRRIYDQLRETPIVLTIEDDEIFNRKSRQALYDIGAVQIEIIPSGINTLSIDVEDPRRPGLNDQMHLRLKADISPDNPSTNHTLNLRPIINSLTELFQDHGVRSGIMVDANLTRFGLGDITDEFYGYSLAVKIAEQGYRLPIAMMTSDNEVGSMTKFINGQTLPDGTPYNIHELRKLDPTENYRNINTFVSIIKS